MKKNRDNFPKAVISTLERRVNGHCSNPDCRVPTSGPNLGKNSANCIGVAAHIAAAAPGGPRYNMAQTIEERKSFENGIWLCVNCATRIDRDDKRYTVELLGLWKRQAEQDAFDEMGKVPISRKSFDALKAVALGDFQKKSLSNAVHEICKLSANELEKIDPRFSVNVDYRDKKTFYTLNPQETIDCSISVVGPAAEEFLGKYTDLVDHGTPLEVDMEAVTLEGSPLFDLHNGTAGKIVFEPINKRSAVCKVSIEGNIGQIALDDIKGSVIGGRKSFTFSGDTFENYLSLVLSLDLSKVSDKSSKITFTHSFSVWHGRLVSQLPYFLRIYQFYEAAAFGCLMRISLQIDGEEVMSGQGKNVLKESEAREVFAILRYIRNVRAIAKFIGANVVFKEGVKLNADDVRDAENIYNWIVELPKLKGKEIGSINFTMHPNGEPSSEFMRLMAGEVGAIHFAQELLNPISMFGAITKIPAIHFSYSAMKLVRYSEVAEGAIEMTLESDPSCICHVYLVGSPPNA